MFLILFVSSIVLSRFPTSSLIFWCLSRRYSSLHISVFMRKVQWSSLGLLSFVPMFVSYRFHITLFLLLWCLFLLLVSPLLFSCASYLVCDTHLMHGIPIVHASWSLVFRGNIANSRTLLSIGHRKKSSYSRTLFFDYIA